MSSNDLISLANEVATQKENIRQAIVTAGVACSEDTPLADYAGKISQIQYRIPEFGAEIFYRGNDSSLTQESTTYTVPTTYAAIAPNGLSGYANLQSVTMQNVTSVMDFAFAGDKKLTTINAPLCKYYGAGALVNTGLNGAYVNNVAESFGACCFKGNTAITSFNLAAARFIGANCFEGCNKAESISIPNVERIGDSAFVNFGNNRYDSDAVLQKFDFSAPKAKTIGQSAFRDNKAVQSINLPQAEYIGAYAFYGCDNLSDINLSQLEYIGGYAFYQRPLNSLTVKDGCYIDEFACYNTSLTAVMGKPGYINKYAFHNDEITSIDLSLVTYIGTYALISAAIKVADLSNCAKIELYGLKLGAGAKMWLPSAGNCDIDSSSSVCRTGTCYIYTDAADASSRPSTWSNLPSATWIYGSTYEDFLKA